LLIAAGIGILKALQGGGTKEEEEAHGQEIAVNFPLKVCMGTYQVYTSVLSVSGFDRFVSTQEVYIAHRSELIAQQPTIL
jgi:hypothetical protein